MSASFKLAGFTPEQIRVYRAHFQAFDLNGDGMISAKELRKASKKLGYRLTDEQIEVKIHLNNYRDHFH